MINGKKDTYDLVEEKVREYWEQTYPQDVIAFFEQKYDSPYDNEWVKHEELVMSYGDYCGDKMEFLTDFCEGQTLARNIKIVPLFDVLQYYREQVIDCD